MTLLSMAQVAGAIAQLLESHRGEFDRACRPLSMGSILPYYTGSIDAGMYPVVMIEEQSVAMQWEALPDFVKETYSLAVWGMVLHDDPNDQARIRAEMARVVNEALSLRNRSTPVPGTPHSLYWDEVVPISSIEFGSAPMQTSIVGAFRAVFTCHCLAQYKDHKPR